MKKGGKRSKTQFAPGPWELPIIGSLHHLLSGQPHHVLRDLAKKHGPLMHLQLGEVSAIIVSSPEMAKEVMKKHDLALADRFELIVGKIMFYNSTSIASAPYGDYWRQLRKICFLELLSAKRVQSFRSVREEEVSKLIRSISMPTTGPELKAINLSEKLFSMMNDITSRAAFGEKCKDKDTFLFSMHEALKLASGFDVVDLFPSKKFLHVISGTKSRLKKIQRKIDEILSDLIKEHKENKTMANKGESKEDLVDILLRFQDGCNLEFPITTDNIKAVILEPGFFWDYICFMYRIHFDKVLHITIKPLSVVPFQFLHLTFVSPTRIRLRLRSDTSATTIEWAMSELMKNPRAMEKAQAEVREVFKGKVDVDETDFHKLTYLKLVIKETLRLHPPVPLLIPRECRERCEIDGYEIPTKTKVIVNAWAIGRDPEHWKDSESFEPERFDGGDIDYKGTNFEFIPFGAGRRMCPGILFGIANIELPLVQLLYKFDWKLPNGVKPNELDMTECLGATMTKNNNLSLVPTLYGI
ncbi:hypothetical protein GIB67_001001 [Kingdonia uniflora]|uniref:Cytochrome P450 n=1 Tax=Kingdonia uniflora TaxID=39325 RepID=A0A7J7MGB6_9MAGN|nr:hypothetical protein GIB67_001001 [Kingdonia uniflora]